MAENVPSRLARGRTACLPLEKLPPLGLRGGVVGGEDVEADLLGRGPLVAAAW